MNPAARRYAKAIFDLAVEENALDRVTTEMKSVGNTVASSSELREILASPLVAQEARKAVMSAVLQRLGVSTLVRNAVLLITDHRRGALLPEIAELLTRLADERAGKLQAEVISATPLTESQYARLTAVLERLTNRKIALVRKVDPSLIGGVITRIGDKMYDGSIRSRLAELRTSLLPN